MGQILHGCARSTKAMRRLFQRNGISKLPVDITVCLLRSTARVSLCTLNSLKNKEKFRRRSF